MIAEYLSDILLNLPIFRQNGGRVLSFTVGGNLPSASFKPFAIMPGKDRFNVIEGRSEDTIRRPFGMVRLAFHLHT